jgi:hypothetical protein
MRRIIQSVSNIQILTFIECGRLISLILYVIDVVAAIKEISETSQILTKNQRMVY